MNLTNNGVGPARLEAIEFLYNGTNWIELNRAAADI